MADVTMTTNIFDIFNVGDTKILQQIHENPKSFFKDSILEYFENSNRIFGVYASLEAIYHCEVDRK